MKSAPGAACLLDLCWSLSADGAIPGQYIHHVNEPCAHSPEQAAAVLAHLRGLSAPKLATLALKLKKSTSVRKRFWGASNRCELCEFLIGLSQNGRSRQPAGDPRFGL